MKKAKLTQREQQIVKLIAEGLTNKEIAAALGMSEETVKTHIKKIMLKLNVDNRGKVIAWYFRSCGEFRDSEND